MLTKGRDNMKPKSFGREPMKRAAIYARVQPTSQEQDNFALISQIEQCKAYCQEKGYSVEEKHIYSQSQIEAIELMPEPRPFDILIVCSIDRLSRSQVQAAAIIDRLNQHGVTVESVDGTIQDDIAKLAKVIKEAVAQIERQQIIKRMKHGREAKKAQREQQQ